MTLASMQRFVARLLAEPGFLERYQAAPESTLLEFEVTPEEARVLRRLDLSRIGMVCEGYAGKRTERIESAFPWTLRALGPDAGRIVSAHLARHPPTTEEARELAAFAALAEDAVPEPWRRRLVADVAETERILRARPDDASPAAARWSATLRLRLAGGVAHVRTRGDLPAALLRLDALEDYPESPLDALVRFTARGLTATRLQDAEARLLRAVAAGAPVGSAATDAAGEARLRAWYAEGVLVPDA